MLKIDNHLYYRSEDYYSCDITPKRITSEYELEIYEGGTGVTYIDGKKYAHAKGNLIFAKPGQERFTMGSFHCRAIWFVCTDSCLNGLFCALPDWISLREEEYEELVGLWESCGAVHYPANKEGHVHNESPANNKKYADSESLANNKKYADSESLANNKNYADNKSHASNKDHEAGESVGNPGICGSCEKREEGNSLAERLEEYEKVLRICSLAARAAGRSQTVENRPPGRYLKNLMTAKEAIDEHFREPIQIKDMAEKAFLSPNFFRRKFTEEFGLSPSRYLLELRLSHAVKQILTTDMPLSQIAYESGFGSQSYMNYVFKKEFAMSPLPYREKLKNMETKQQRSSG